MTTIASVAPNIRFFANTKDAMDMAPLVEYFDFAGCTKELDLSYRYIVEAISNVYEHARAPSEPDIEWSVLAQQIAAGFEIKVRDWGRGIVGSIAERGFAAVSDREAISLALSGCGQSRSERGLGIRQITNAVDDSRLVNFQLSSGRCAFNKYGSRETYQALPDFVQGTDLTILLPTVGEHR